MSDMTIFRFTTSSPAIHHTALDPDASARLAAFTGDPIDTQNASSQSATAVLESESLNTCTANEPENSAQVAQTETADQSQTEPDILATMISESAAIPSANEIDMSDPLAILAQTIAAAETSNALDAAPEIELAQVELAPVEVTEIESAQIAACDEAPVTEASTDQPIESSIASPVDSPIEVTGILSAVEAASEMIVHHTTAPEPLAEDISLIETTVAETDISAETESSAPAPLEVAPILDASGELQADADAYVPPAPFEINVAAALPAENLPAAELLADDVVADDAETRDLSETFDLDSICAPTEAEQIIESAIAREDAVAEMNAAAKQFVAEQIASDDCTVSEAPAAPASAAADLVANETAAPAASTLASAAEAIKSEAPSDRRRKRRALISAPIRVRSIHVATSGPDEISTTVDVSRYGILFYTVLDTYQRGMDVAVVFPYHKSATGVHAEQFGRVVRLHDMPDGRHAVAIALGVGVGEHLVDSSGRKLSNEPVQLSNSTAPAVKKPMVLMADSDSMLRDTMKIFLQNEGYEVIAVNNANDAREVLNMFMPAMIVAEIEGESDLLPGLDLCAHVKSSPSLRHIPVVLTSRSAYPSDYSNAHSLGAVVCMAKPYKQERLGHIVRLLAPLPEHLQSTGAQRVPDPTRGFRGDCNVTSRQNGTTQSRNGAKKSPAATKPRFKFPSFR